MLIRPVLDYIHDILSDRFKVNLITEASELERCLNNSPAPDLLLMDWNIVEGENDENALGTSCQNPRSKAAPSDRHAGLLRRFEGSDHRNADGCG